jgi:hypothetical protein
MSKPSQERPQTATTRKGRGLLVVGGVAPGDAHDDAPRPTAAARASGLGRYADAACYSEKTTLVHAHGRYAGTLPSRNRVPSALFGGGDTDKDGATMGDDGVRGADANMGRGRRANGPAAPPKRILSNREIADGLFAALGDFYALERGAFRPEDDAGSPCAEEGHEAEPGDGRSDVRGGRGTSR